MPSSELQGGRRTVTFSICASLLLGDGFMIGVNVMWAHYVNAAIFTIVSVLMVVSLVRLYQSDIRLVRVQERLRRSRAEDDIEMDATGPTGPTGYWVGQGRW